MKREQSVQLISSVDKISMSIESMDLCWQGSTKSIGQLKGLGAMIQFIW